MREIHLARQCSEMRNVVRMLGITFVADNPSPSSLAIVFEWMPYSLADRLQQDTWAWGIQGVSIMRQIAEGMQQLHQRTPVVLHRDLKPSNVLLSQDHHVYLCDLGCAREAKTGGVYTPMSSSWKYDGTDVFRDPVEENRRTFQGDVYSFGVLGIMAMTGAGTGEKEPLGKLESLLSNRSVLEQKCADQVSLTLFLDCIKPATVERPTFQEIANRLRTMQEQQSSTLLINDIEIVRASSGTRKAYVYRIMEARDRFGEGLVAGAGEPNPDITPATHVSRCDRSLESSYISFSKSLEWEMWMFGKLYHISGIRPERLIVVRVDLDLLMQLDPKCAILDVSDHNGTNKHMPNALNTRGKNYAEEASEVGCAIARICGCVLT